MLWYILKRLLYMIPVLLCVVIIVFTLMYITPGDPARSILGDSAMPEAVTALRESMHLDDPYFTQLWRYLNQLVLHGDMGNSYKSQQPVIVEILARYPSTLKLTFYCLIFALITGVGVGIISAVKQYSWIDNICVAISLLGVSAPVFWVGMLLILIFSVFLGWLPPSGSAGPLNWIMPVVTLGGQTSAYIMRITRSSMLEVIRQDYIRTARSKGQTEFITIVRHALRNALIPIITIAGNQVCVLLAGATVTETIFSLPGIGKLLVDSMNWKDYATVQGVVLWVGLNSVIINLIVDIIYCFVDPKVKTSFFKRKAKSMQKEVNVNA